MHWVLTVDTRHLLCYYVLSGRYSQRDVATYANWAPNWGTEEWLQGCSRPAGKQEPWTPADCKKGFTGQKKNARLGLTGLKLCSTLLWKTCCGQPNEWFSFPTETEWNLKRAAWKDKWLTAKHTFRQTVLPHHLQTHFFHQVQNWLRLSIECSSSDWECCSSGKMTDITASLWEYYQALVKLCRISCATCFKVAGCRFYFRMC